MLAVMRTKTVDVGQPDTQLSNLLPLVSEGIEVIITRGETPLARLVPITVPAGSRVAGLHAGAVSVADDFDDPLPEEYWAATA
jgi:antitoxin (DNA-binding transcriptional repressor) of toxin-antitoxin stability system